MTKEATYTIKSLASALGLSEVYVRRAILEKKLDTSLEPIKEGSEIMRHRITQASVDSWRGSTTSRSRREDGRNKFNLYATQEELAALKTMIEKAGSQVIIQKAPTYYKNKKAKSK